jgi:hypothetical protein
MPRLPVASSRCAERYSSTMHSSRRLLVLTAMAAALALAGCASPSGSNDPYAGQRSPSGYGGYGGYGAQGSDPYYRGTRIIYVDPHAERLERNQAEEREDLDQKQNEEARELKRQQEQQREALKRADEWDKQDKQAQESQRKQQKKVFEQEDRELRDQQREEWQRY